MGENKDGNEQYRQQATLDPRMFIERFAEDLFRSQTKADRGGRRAVGLALAPNGNRASLETQARPR
jgi:hypothetical protein